MMLYFIKKSFSVAPKLFLIYKTKLRKGMISWLDGKIAQITINTRAIKKLISEANQLPQKALVVPSRIISSHYLQIVGYLYS